MKNTPKRHILPDGLSNPNLLRLTHHFPFILLLLLNSLFFWILKSEMDRETTTHWVFVLAGGGGLLIYAEGMRHFLKKKHLPVSPGLCLISMILTILYLAMITMLYRGMIPEAEALWILSPVRWMGLQYTLIMPALFFSTLRVACFPIRASKPIDLGVSLAGAFLIPFSTYLFVTLISDAFSLFAGVMVSFLVISTLLSMMLILRALASVYLLSTQTETGQAITILLIALVAPLAGLALNGTFPFPADYQDPWVYGLTVINAMLLLIPLRLLSARARPFLWIMQWVMMPFTLYFFLVFLPWLPLSLLAMIAMGAGFLILAPTGLMLIHSLKIRDNFQTLHSRHSKAILITLAVIGFSALPTAYVARALYHRQVLHQALAYVYEPDYSAPASFEGHRRSLRSALDHLHRHYEGRYVPYLSDLYDALVFNGMIVPESKLSTLYQVFYGEELPELDSKHNLWMTSRRNRRAFGVNLGSPPPTFEQIETLSWTIEEQEDCLVATATLTLTNPLGREAEFIQKIDLPPGVWVTDYWLNVDGVQKPGRISEKKTALWVYRMIRDATRRDPGLLVYTSPRKLELRVFPFSDKQTRETGIEFTLPKNNPAALSIGAFEAPLPPREEQRPIRIDSENHDYIGIPEIAEEIPPVIRTPALSFLIDRSLISRGRAKQSLKEALASLPEELKQADTRAMLYALDYEVTPLTKQSQPLESLMQFLPDTLKPRSSGMMLDRGLAEILMRYHRDMSSGTLADAMTYPRAIVLSGEASPVSVDESWELLARDIPEWSSPAIFHHGLWDKPLITNADPVHLLRSGNQLRAIALDASWSDWWLNDAESIEVFMNESEQFIQLDSVETPSPKLSGLSSAIHAYRNYTLYGPEHTTLRDVVKKARDARVLTPSTAFIVLENEAQEKMLKLKEQQKLSGPDAVDFMDAPEPQGIILIGFAIWLAFLHSRRSGSRNALSSIRK